MKRLLLIAACAATFLLGGAELPTIYLAGDSTVCDYPAERAPMTGWGQALKDFCKPGVTVVNLAAGGRSTKSFQTEGRWKKLVDSLKPGDYVFIQFGHNDQKKNVPKLYAAADTDYRANLEKFIADVRAKKATPILCTPVSRRHFSSNGEFRPSLGRYPEVVRKTARAQHVALIDLTDFTEKLFRAVGPEDSQKYLTIVAPGEYPGYPKGPKDNTHYSRLGATTIAREVVRSAREQRLPVSECFVNIK